ncbi:threonine synthase [Alphaproteobacteria bacterium]|nr:threonine synthase [Alphaproteobacteria bacterium]
MRYLSTRGVSPILDFESVLFEGLASDGGLYMPEIWPKFSSQDINNFASLTYPELSAEILHPFIGQSLDKTILNELTKSAYESFSHPLIAPVRDLSKKEFLLELYHGPTLAFKDFAMQLLCKIFEYFLVKSKKKLTLLCATSGDTGAAAVEAYKGMRGINIIVLFPKGRISSVQQKQITTVHEKNVHAIAIEGNFDECQSIVKQIFKKEHIKKKYSLSAVNSINWVRVMAQIVYYFYSALQVNAAKEKVSFSVPTGNFGDIFAGYAALKMGLPIDKLCIATNHNDILTRFFDNGVYKVNNVIPSYSPSMDIQVSSNFERLLFDLSGGDSSKIVDMMEKLKKDKKFAVEPELLKKVKANFVADRVSESLTLDTIKEEWLVNNHLIDPHTAVGVAAGRKNLPFLESQLIYVSTAHPAKFPETVIKATNNSPSMPSRLKSLIEGKEVFTTLNANVNSVEKYIYDNILL